MNDRADPPASPPQPAAPPVRNHTTGVRTTAMVIIACAAAAFVLYVGREFFVPIVFAVLLNALFRPVVRFLERPLHLPPAAGGAVVVLAVCAAFCAVGFAMAGPIQHWIREAPQRFATAEQKLNKLRRPVQQVTDVANQIQHAAQGATTAPSAPEVTIAPVPSTPSLASRWVGMTEKVVVGLVEVLLLLYLLLAAGDLFVSKLIKIIPYWPDKRAAMTVVDQSQSVVMRYLLVTLFINLGQGIVVGLVMWWLKMPNPLLWGLSTV
ncbi:MAG TPA: AI-2E family transporter, partial [Tepidisphaeraceae bacterium]